LIACEGSSNFEVKVLGKLKVSCEGKTVSCGGRFIRIVMANYFICYRIVFVVVVQKAITEINSSLKAHSYFALGKKVKSNG
jgi:hypothetical protein